MMKRGKSYLSIHDPQQEAKPVQQQLPYPIPFVTQLKEQPRSKSQRYNPRSQDTHQNTLTKSQLLKSIQLSKCNKEVRPRQELKS